MDSQKIERPFETPFERYLKCRPTHFPRLGTANRVIEPGFFMYSLY